jgi:hypothetical protein
MGIVTKNFGGGGFVDPLAPYYAALTTLAGQQANLSALATNPVFNNLFTLSHDPTFSNIMTLASSYYAELYALAHTYYTQLVFLCGLPLRSTGTLILANSVFEVTGLNCDVNGAFEVTFVNKVLLSGVSPIVRLLVNSENYLPFLNAGEIHAWGMGLNAEYSGINILAGDSIAHPALIEPLVGDVITCKIWCDVPQQSRGEGKRPIRLEMTHSSSGNTVTVQGVFILDEGYVEGQNINSVGLQIENGSWQGGSNYTLSRKPF